MKGRKPAVDWGTDTIRVAIAPNGVITPMAYGGNTWVQSWTNHT